MNEGAKLFGAMVASVLGLALVSVLVSKNAATAQVIGAGSSGLAGLISAATAPVTGSGGVSLQPQGSSFVGGGGSGGLSFLQSGFGGNFSPMSMLSNPLGAIGL